jgi:hypothetical protein
MVANDAASNVRAQFESAVLAKVSLHDGADRVDGIRPDLERPCFALLLFWIGTRIDSRARRCSAPLAGPPPLKAKTFANIVAACERIVAGMAIDDETVRHSRDQFDRKRSIGAAVTGTRGVNAIAAGNVAAECVCNCAGVHHANAHAVRATISTASASAINAPMTRRAGSKLARNGRLTAIPR